MKLVSFAKDGVASTVWYAMEGLRTLAHVCAASFPILNRCWPTGSLEAANSAVARAADLSFEDCELLPVIRLPKRSFVSATITRNTGTKQDVLNGTSGGVLAFCR